jgi:alpha-glucosidase
MQWDDTPNAGFTPSTPWLPLSEDWRTRNVAVEEGDRQSMLSLYKRLITLRQSEPALMVGSYEAMAANADMLAYVRAHESGRFLVVLNLGAEAAEFGMPEGAGRGKIVVCTAAGREGEYVAGTLEVRGNEGIVVEVES